MLVLDEGTGCGCLFLRTRTQRNVGIDYLKKCNNTSPRFAQCTTHVVNAQFMLYNSPRGNM